MTHVAEEGVRGSDKRHLFNRQHTPTVIRPNIIPPKVAPRMTPFPSPSPSPSLLAFGQQAELVSFPAERPVKERDVTSFVYTHTWNISLNILRYYKIMQSGLISNYDTDEFDGCTTESVGSRS